ncbi:MAG: RDD family protein [candidate division Zixibacteria bacterium]
MTQMPPPTMPPPAMAPPMSIKAEAPLAGRGTRLLAAIVDSACAIVIYLASILFDSPAILFLGLAGFAVYQIYLLTMLGQTIGKKTMNIRIVKFDTGENGGFGTNVGMRGIVNGLLGLIPFYSLTDIFFIFRDDRRCIHDFIAGTKVVEV